jgi:small redox-active disulfide protein 2
MERLSMKEIKVLGIGCSSCKATVKLINEIARGKGVDISIEKVEDIREIMAYNVLSTPGVVLDGQVVHAGGVPSRQKVEGWFPDNASP